MPKNTKFSIELLKQTGFIIVNVLWTILKHNAKPIYTTTVKTFFITTLIYLIAIIPSPISVYLLFPGFWGWASILLIWRLINVRYDDFEVNETDEENNEEIIIPEDEEENKPIIKKELPQIIKQEPEEDESTSTRE